MNPRSTSGVLHLYHRPTSLFGPDAVTVGEHVGALRSHSRFRVWEVNTHLGFPRGLRGLRFASVVLHYSLFGTSSYRLDQEFLDFLAGESSESYKVAFFQDEFRFCRRRFAFLDEFRIDCVFSCLEPEYLDRVYGSHTGVSCLVSNIPGYVGGEMLAAGRRFAIPEPERRTDVGYRGRPLPAYAGRGGQEKYEIGVRFEERASDLDLRLDIAGGEEDRIYGDEWYRFLAGCRAVLGTESGVDVFDLEDEVVDEYERLLADGEEPTVERLEQGPLPRWEGEIPYRTIGPRHFEAAALDVCQILFEGRYSGAMEPMVHYIPLAKDFSNFDEAVGRFRDRSLRLELTANARRDLIESGEWAYERLVARFDGVLADAGLEPAISEADAHHVESLLRRGSQARLARARALEVLERAREKLPGRRALRSLVGPALRRAERARGRNRA